VNRPQEGKAQETPQDKPEPVVSTKIVFSTHFYIKKATAALYFKRVSNEITMEKNWQGWISINKGLTSDSLNTICCLQTRFAH
jgi:hypothetical protein